MIEITYILKLYILTSKIALLLTLINISIEGNSTPSNIFVIKLFSYKLQPFHPLRVTMTFGSFFLNFQISIEFRQDLGVDKTGLILNNAYVSSVYRRGGGGRGYNDKLGYDTKISESPRTEQFKSAV